jgi:M6 family metalloprotease-like protein
LKNNITNIHKIYIVIILFITISFYIKAIQAYRNPINVFQPDGQKITILLHGDENFHYRTTSDGYLIAQDEKGYFNYAEVGDDGSILSLNIQVSSANQKTQKEQELLSNLTPVTTADFILSKSKIQKAKSTTTSELKETGFPLSGVPKSLVILVNFSDKNFNNDQTAFTNLLNQQGYSTNGGTGSARDYFSQNSLGKFDPQFNVVGPYTLPNNIAYYGGNDASGNDKNPRQMVIDACTLADSAGVDFTQYDTDNDGFVDNIFVYYAGYNEAEGASVNTIWPHRWTLASYNTKFDGKIIYDYACTSELKGISGVNMCGIGTFVHEFGHVLGLPDFYATNSATHHTLYSWDVMDYGPYNNSGRTPPNYSSYERFFLGWLTPTEIKSPVNISLDTLSHSNQAYLISQTGSHNLNGENPNPIEFFMLENRQKSGWDKYLSGHGLLITHIYYNSNTWNSNTVNNTSTAMGVDIIEADGIATDASCSGDVFPGTSKVTSYTPILRAGVDIGKPITVITETNGVITFKFKGGEFPVDKAPVATDATNITQTSFTATWNAVEYADKYLLDVFMINETDTTYLTGYQQKDVGSVTSFSLTGLTSGSTYYYRLKATSDTIKTIYSNVISVRTLEYTFDMLKPVSLAASDITSSSFTANWTQMDDATEYIINAYTKKQGTTSSDSLFEFATFPDNWSKNFILTYTSSGMYGNESPALRMSTQYDYVQTNVFDEAILGLKFWYRGAGVHGSNYLQIYTSIDGVTWSLIKEISSLKNTAQTVSVTLEELGLCYAVKIVYQKSGSGDIALDDMVLSFINLDKEVIEPYNNYSVGNQLSYRINNLLPETTYYYNVIASNGSVLSKISEEVEVKTDLSDANALQQTSDGSNYKIFIKKNQIYVSTHDNSKKAVFVINIAGQVLYNQMIGESDFSISLDQYGIYFLKINNHITKIVL